MRARKHKSLKGEHNGRAKRTEADVARIRRAAKYARLDIRRPVISAPRNLPYGFISKLAREFKTSPGMVHDILTGRKWACTYRRNKAKSAAA